MERKMLQARKEMMMTYTGRKKGMVWSISVFNRPLQKVQCRFSAS
jgi:hypothetical protein